MTRMAQRYPNVSCVISITISKQELAMTFYKLDGYFSSHMIQAKIW